MTREYKIRFIDSEAQYSETATAQWDTDTSISYGSCARLKDTGRESSVPKVGRGLYMVYMSSFPCPMTGITPISSPLKKSEANSDFFIFSIDNNQ